ncbi:chitobiase/beta-hexosaminidase C-terminal domain-containing protein [Faecalicatena sp. Marseille-Q4148]|nr:chitobiase/beta-hexosaminidase C-terminal domain-containing protein [Faecalicatena sp. Marseille-Q4148]
MKCKNCGAAIPEGYLYCEKCGQEVQIVPDYNPLDDVLTAQVKGALEEEPSNRTRNRIPIENLKNSNGMISYTMNIPLPNAEDQTEHHLTEKRREEKERLRRDEQRKERAESIRQSELRERKHQEERARRRRENELKRKKQKAKKRMRILIGIGVVVILGALGYFIYLNTYYGLVRGGNRYLNQKDYRQAEEKFQQAMKQDDAKADAYNGLAEVYIAQNEPDTAEDYYLKAISKYPGNVELYRGCIEFYQQTDQLSKIPVLLDECEDDGVLDDLNMYVSNEPKFSLEEKTYDEVQELSLTSKGQKIYYTTDGTEPTTASAVYETPIQIGEGTTTISAISVNDEGVPSIVVSKTYVVEYPVADAPAVSPSTGYYERQMQITIQVPSGYTAYYTISSADGEIETPTAASTKYTGPIDMPEGNHIFCAVLVDGKGRLSEIKKMNYELILQ